MGYTHYWDIAKGANKANYKDALADIGRFVNWVQRAYPEIKLVNGMGEEGTNPELVKWVGFNGEGELSHETFYLEETPKAGFSFCKTNHKPYDSAVVACIMILKRHMGCDITISSDGFSYSPNNSYFEIVDGFRLLMEYDNIKIETAPTVITKMLMLWINEEDLEGEPMLKLKDVVKIAFDNA